MPRAQHKPAYIHGKQRLATLCRVAVMARYADGTSAFVAMFAARHQAEAFARAKREEQGGGCDPKWTVERL